MKKTLLITLAVILMCAGAAAADQITLTWDANTPAPEGYRLFQRVANGSYDYTAPIWTGASAPATIEVPDGTYAWVVRAYDGSLESADSNEVVLTVEPQPPAIIYPGRPKQLIINFE